MPMLSMKVKPLFTPVFRLLHLDALKPAMLRKQRFSLRRGRRTSELPLPSRQSVRSAYEVSSTSNSYCIALLNEVDDAVVVTALSSVPFCCHADLLSMARPELLAVALKLNARLPVALQIDLSPIRPDAYIRNAIELLVGIKRVAPAAPHPARARTLYGTDEPSTSPLAARSRSQGSFLSIGSPLVAVEEEPDGEESARSVRPAKKRKLADADIDDAPPPLQPALAMASTPQLTRAQTERLELVEPDSPTPSRMLRSQSVRVSGSTDLCVDAAFITTKRPRRRYRPKRFIARTSTPKRAKTTIQDISDMSAGRLHPTFDQSELTFGLEGLTVAPVHSADDLDVPEVGSLLETENL